MTTRLMIVTLAAASVSGNLVMANEFGGLVLDYPASNQRVVERNIDRSAPAISSPTASRFAQSHVRLQRPEPLGGVALPSQSAVSQLPADHPNSRGFAGREQVSAQAVSHYYPWDRQAGACCDTQPVQREVVTCDQPLFRLPKLPKPKLCLPKPKIRLPKLNCASGNCGELVDAVACNSGCCHLNAEVGNCPPRQPVNLPHGSFYGAFKADRCDTSVWDGYQRLCKPIGGGSCCDGQCGEVMAPNGCGCSTGCDHPAPTPTCDCEG